LRNFLIAILDETSQLKFFAQNVAITLTNAIGIFAGMTEQESNSQRGTGRGIPHDCLSPAACARSISREELRQTSVID
jgi:hypothetical protein